MDMLISTANEVFPKLNLEKEQLHILVFKTNIRYKKDIKVVSSPLNQSSFIIGWSIDLDDCDKILRVESQTTDCQNIISIIQKAGYCCEELAD